MEQKSNSYHWFNSIHWKHPLRNKLFSEHSSITKSLNMAMKFIATTLLLMALCQGSLSKHVRLVRDVEEPIEEIANSSTIPPEGQSISVISGIRDRLENLLTLEPRLKNLANILADINQGIADPQIEGQLTPIKSLFETVATDELLQGLLENDNITDQILEGGHLEDIMSGDDTLTNILAVITRSNVPSARSSVNGEELVNKLVNGVFDSVEQVIDSLLLLLGNLSESLSKNLPQQVSVACPAPGKFVLTMPGPSDRSAIFSFFLGSPNEVNTLNQAVVRLNALINALTTLKQEIVQSKQPCATPSNLVVVNSA